MSHTRKTPPIKAATANLPTDVDAGTMALDTTTNEQKVFNGTAWEVVEGEFIGTTTIVFDSTGPAYDQIQGDIPVNWKNIDTSLKGVVIGTSCTSIGDNAFDGCTGLGGSLAIPDSITSIGVRTFKNCSGLTGSLLIPNSVTTIGNNVFEGCSGFTGPLTIPDSITFISSSAFTGCSGLTSLTIPNSVTSIGLNFLSSCLALTNINCYAEKSALDSASCLSGSSVTTVHVRSTDNTWTAGAGQTIGGRAGIEVIKDL